MLRKVLCSVVVFVFCLTCFNTGFSAEEKNSEELELEFWTFFAELDTVATYNKVIKKYFAEDRSKEDKIRGVNAIVNLIKEKVSDGGLLSIGSLVRYDEEFFNIFMNGIDDINFKKYALQYIIPTNGAMPLEEKALLRQSGKKLEENSFLLRIFDRYSHILYIKEEDYDLMISALVVAQYDAQQLEDIKAIKDIIQKASWSGNKAKLLRMFDYMYEYGTRLDKANYIPESYSMSTTYRYNPLLGLKRSLREEQSVELFNIILQDPVRFNDLFLQLDESLQKYIGTAMIAYRPSISEDISEEFILDFLNIYKNKESLTSNEFSLIDTMVLAIRKMNKDSLYKIMETLKSSKWIEESQNSKLVYLWYRVCYRLSSSLQDFIEFLKIFPIKSTVSYDISRLEKYSDEELNNNIFLQSVVKDIFNGYKDINLNIHDCEILSKIVDYLSIMKDTSFIKEILDIVNSSKWMVATVLPDMTEVWLLKVRIEKLAADNEDNVDTTDECFKYFVD